LGGVFAYVIHDLAQITIDLKAARVSVVVSGHSHMPGIQHRDAVLFLNPGSCGRRRFRLPISIGEILIEGEHLQARTVDLQTS
jgi:predicted phosphodiesterase